MQSGIKSCWKHFCVLSYILVSKFVVVTTRWSNCSHSRNFHASSQDNISLQTYFSFRDNTWPAPSPGHAVPDYVLWGYAKSKVYETIHGNIADLKQRILECIEGILKEMLQFIMIAFSSRLQECIERHKFHV